MTHGQLMAERAVFPSLPPVASTSSVPFQQIMTPAQLAAAHAAIPPPNLRMRSVVSSTFSYYLYKTLLIFH
jgi:hypothetical protein